MGHDCGDIMGDKRVTVGLIQASVSPDIDRNLKNTVKKIEEAARRGAQLICLSELYRTRYFPQQENADARGLAETIPGDSTQTFSRLAKKHRAALIVPVFEKAPDGYYNTAAVIDADGTLLGTYRKLHIPHDPLFYEKNYFKPGDAGYKVFRTEYAAISVLICYDQWFPEAARICTLGGADIIFYPTAIGWIKDYEPEEGDWLDAWETIQRSHAIANSVHVAAVNRVGSEGELVFWGSSFVCDPFGNVLARAGRDGEEVLIAELDLERNRVIREGWGFLRNRRPDTYGPLAEK